MQEMIRTNEPCKKSQLRLFNVFINYDRAHGLLCSAALLRAAARPYALYCTIVYLST
jgi:hypothetical protein